MMMILTALAGVAMTPAPQKPNLTEELGKCLIARTSEADKLALVRWIFAMSSASPKVAEMSNVTPAQRTEHNKGIGALFVKLISKDCRQEAVTAMRHGGQAALEASFGKLGEVAMTNLMDEPAVNASVTEMGMFAATPDLIGVLQEAGMGSAGATPPKP